MASVVGREEDRLAAGDHHSAVRAILASGVNVEDHLGSRRLPVGLPQLGSVDAVVGLEIERRADYHEALRIGAARSGADVVHQGCAGGRAVGAPELGARGGGGCREIEIVPHVGELLGGTSPCTQVDVLDEFRGRRCALGAPELVAGGRRVCAEYDVVPDLLVGAVTDGTGCAGFDVLRHVRGPGNRGRDPVRHDLRGRGCRGSCDE